ncbi:MAG: glycoside hydrolase family protein [Bacteroidales bacterium]|jgi:hypothetical protein|nr:glycoside hydrolase family protein [Bacteroidales bacterium]
MFKIKKIAFIVFMLFCITCVSGQESFSDRFMPVPLNSGFQMEGFHVWCGSITKGEDGRYYMFASRWPEGGGYDWVLDSEVVLASADKPTGPYKYESVVLPKRGTKYWDGMMTHNPTIHKYKDTYLLYYTGTTYPERKYPLAWANKRIGLATAKSVKGPWKLLDAPILEPRPGKWDNQITSNAAPCIMPDGKVILVYKSTKTGFWTNGHWDFNLRLGVALADSFEGPYKQVSDEPILTFSGTKDSNAEDACIWHDKDGFHMICKVFEAGHTLVGQNNAGICAVSKDGVNWQLAEHPKAYSRTIVWEDGRKETMKLLERPQLLIEDGVITHINFAAITPEGKLRNIVVPLRADNK